MDLEAQLATAHARVKRFEQARAFDVQANGGALQQQLVQQVQQHLETECAEKMAQQEFAHNAAIRALQTSHATALQRYIEAEQAHKVQVQSYGAQFEQDAASSQKVCWLKFGFLGVFLFGNKVLEQCVMSICAAHNGS